MRLYRLKMAVQLSFFGLSIIGLATAASSKSASAQSVITCDAKTGCSDWRNHRRQVRGGAQHRRGVIRRIARPDANGNAATIIGARPAACPHDYCGCGLRKFLGLVDKRLNLAWNWARFFPRTTPQPGAAAVRHHHVMLLVRPVAGSRWVVRDYNSGGGLSRIHERDVRGYVFVDPRKSRLAMM